MWKEFWDGYSKKERLRTFINLDEVIGFAEHSDEAVAVQLSAGATTLVGCSYDEFKKMFMSVRFGCKEHSNEKGG